MTFMALFPVKENTLLSIQDNPKHFFLFLTQAVFPQSQQIYNCGLSMFCWTQLDKFLVSVTTHSFFSINSITLSLSAFLLTEELARAV